MCEVGFSWMYLQCTCTCEWDGCLLNDIVSVESHVRWALVRCYVECLLNAMCVSSKSCEVGFS